MRQKRLRTSRLQPVAARRQVAAAQTLDGQVLPAANREWAGEGAICLSVDISVLLTDQMSKIL
jgi:hypothetical protein